MGVWLGPRGKRELSIYKVGDSGTFTAKADDWIGASAAKVPTIGYTGGLSVSLSKAQYATDPVGIAVSNSAYDLTGYTKVKVNVTGISGTTHYAVYVSTSNTDFRRNRDLNLYDQSAGTLELDVSQLPAGNYYFGIGVCAYGEPATTAVVTISSIKATK